MFSPEKQQVEICLLKSNLEEIENDLVAQRSAIPALDAENEQKYRETITALREARSLNTEIEGLKQENVRLTAKRMQLKRQSEEVSDALERARRNRSELEDLLKQEERDTELEIRKYEDTLRELASLFRSSRAFYNEDEIKSELEMVEEMNLSFVNEERKLQCNISELKRELTSLRTDIPEDILATIGRMELEQKYKSVSDQCETLQSKLRLTAKRMQLKRQSEEVSDALERARRNRSELEDLLKQEERDTELEIRKYEDTLRELASLFRSSRAFYNEDEIKSELEMVEEMNLSFVNEERKLQCNISELKRELTSLRTDIPEDILATIGRMELEQKYKSVSDQCETLQSKRDYLFKNR